MSALDGVRVIDLTRYLSGPTLTMMLADLGADVVKVETLPAGDPARQSGPFHGSESVYYMASNRNKRSAAIDLRTEEGRDVLLRLIDEADVFVENFRPGTANAMGLSSEALLARNPRLVYVSISGFGTRGPGAKLPGFDQTAQAMSGIMSVTGTEETGPMRVGIAVADSSTGVFAAVGVLAALYERERTGRGGVVEASLMQSMLTLMSYQAQKYLSLGEVAGLVGNDHPIMFPQGTFKTATSSVTVASGNETMWRKLCDVLEVPQLADDPLYRTNADRMANRRELRVLLEEALSTKPAAEWIPLINAAGIPCGPVLNLEDALSSPITEALRMVEVVDHSTLGELKVLGQSVTVSGSTNGWLRRHPPLFGEHTSDVLIELGLTQQEVDDLQSKGVIATGVA
jgi:crotonobetainyl-CoA:carnitine CoA-transferase CaiB-like acyl-CoA transferase